MSIHPPPDSECVRHLCRSTRHGDEAEAAVYRVLDNAFRADTECAVLWSVPVPGGAQAREIDFLVAHRRLGLALIEVKAPPIVPQENGWVDFRSRRAFDRESPERQLDHATNFMKEWWKGLRGDRLVPRIAQFVVLANTPLDVLTSPENAGFLVPGGRIVLADGTSLPLQQRRHTYLCAGDQLALMPEMMSQVLTDQLGKTNRCTVEAAFFRDALRYLAPQAGVREIGASAAETASPASETAKCAPRTRTAPSAGPGQPGSRPSPHRRTASYNVAAIAALAAGWLWLHPSSPPPLPQPAPTAQLVQTTQRAPASQLPPPAQLAPPARGDAPAVKKPPAEQKPKPAKPAKSDDGAGLKLVQDAKGRSCVERHMAGTIGGQAIDLVEKLCRAPDGALQRVSD